MNISLNYHDDLNATMTVSVEKADYAGHVEKALKNYQKKANIPGFRPGKAPLGMIQKMYGTSVLVDEVNNYTSEAINKYIDENKLEVLGQPVLSDDSEQADWSSAGDFTFRFDIGIAPKFELNMGSSDRFVLYKPAISADMLEKEIARVQQRYGNQTEGSQVEDNDIIQVKATELGENGEALEAGVSADSSVLVSHINDEATKKLFLGQSTGAKVKANVFDVFNHDEAEISTAFNISKQTVADLGKMFEFEITAIKRQEPAPLGQELFDKIYGPGKIEGEEAFRNKIREELQQYYMAEANHALEHDMYQTLQDKHFIPLPDAFLKRWLISRHPDKFNADNIDQKYIPEAAYLRSTLFQEKIISSQGLKIEEEDLLNASLAYTKRMFFGYNMNMDISDYLLNYAKEQLKDNNYRSRMINMAIETKVINTMKTLVNIEEQELSMEEFKEKMREHNEKHHAQHAHEHSHEEEHEHSH